ncbi:MAG: hypothetical protein KDK39_07645 [Leptospiraceae bacterium]|nr:hypothetical protein [Leptospiraceae bacterium]
MALTLWIAAPLWADTLYLKNGSQLNGTIVGQSRTVVRIRVGDQVQVIAKTEIRRIVFQRESDNDAAQKRKAEEERRRKAAEAKAAEEEKRRAAEEEKRRAQEATVAEEEQRRAEEAKKAAERRRQEALRREQERNQGPTTAGAFVRSLILPGWGQYYQGRTSDAYLIGGIFAISAGSAVYLDQRYQAADRSYRGDVELFLIGSPFWLSWYGTTIIDTSPFVLGGLLQMQTINQSRSEMQAAARRVNGTRALVLGVYAWNLVDVILWQPNQNQALSINAHQDQLRFQFLDRW